ncbi:MAG: glutamate--tRNA ligase [Candidatus Pacebacteria bacterium]|nr:glutamate--tRNA ligase [Candidatus Paceibacterota bacterium]
MTGENKEVRVRIAPSPTGSLHFGTARTALFNLLFARSKNGKFIIRIEDTDLERSKKKFEEEILEGFEWLGIKSDETIIRQSERGEIYEKYLRKLLEEKKAYFCYCTKEELTEEKQFMLSQGLTPKYNGRCLNSPPKDREPQLIRLKVPEKIINFKDLIRGKVSFDSRLIGDIAIAKNLKTPLYNFAVVIDDFEEKITHVIRGEDHIPNTPKQILIQEVLNIPMPEYAHLPLILNPEGGKMSKRYMETSLLSFREEGYLPEAMINFMAFIGWHPKEDKEIMSLEEIIKEFSIERVQKGGAIFNKEKLEWINSQYLKMMSDEEAGEKIKKFIPKEWAEKKEIFKRAVSSLKERLKKISDFKEEANFLFEIPEYEKKMLLWKETDIKKEEEILKRIKKIIEENTSNRDEKIVALAEEEGRGEVYWPLRVALSGKKNSPPPLELLSILGQTESLSRIERAIEKLKNEK